MKYIKKKPAVLLLQDGTIFHGKANGIDGIATGELCFNTGMTGYQEVFTDPSYFGQLMITTSAHIGNYGIKNNEVESDTMKIAGLICKNFNNGFSREGGDGDLNSYFVKQNKVVISDVDTRAVVRHIRDRGAMNAIISTATTDIVELTKLLKEVPSMEGLELSSSVCTSASYFVGDENAAIKVAVLDLGVKRNILKCMTDRGCYLKVFPMDTTYEEMKKWNPDGFFLSNGPGDPAAMPEVIEQVKKITTDGKAVFGICLGHQALALSQGISTYKMHNGHRGINHPVKNLVTGKAEVTSQNHGFGISEEDINKNPNVEITHINLNDDTIEGIRLVNKNCFSVQYHPESSPGPHDSRYLFDDFINNIKKN
ncbi:MAG: carbamoyl phosphate synthase small subunit [Cryomorphaceae bacterium BACL11 MAG-121015-bin20]|nr:MAG: carbamoyl phosphate synthase small subunit [Cryomorphaceae bacterium BACL11 MAG-121015-bin20]